MQPLNRRLTGTLAALAAVAAAAVATAEEWPEAARLKALPAELRDPAGVVYRRAEKPAAAGPAEVLYLRIQETAP